MQSQDTFQDDDMGRVDREGLWEALMLLEGIGWDVSPLAAQDVSDFLSPSPGWCSRDHKPLFEFLELVDKKVKVKGMRRVQVILVGVSESILLRRQRLVERILDKGQM